MSIGIDIFADRVNRYGQDFCGKLLGYYSPGRNRLRAYVRLAHDLRSIREPSASNRRPIREPSAHEYSASCAADHPRRAARKVFLVNDIGKVFFLADPMPPIDATPPARYISGSGNFR